MPGLFRKAHHLVLDRRTISGPGPHDLPGKEGGAGEGGPDDLMGFFVGIGEPAGAFLPGGGGAVKGKAQLPRVPGLGLHFGKIQALAGDPGGGPGLEPAEGQPQREKGRGEGVGGIHPVGTHVPNHLAGEGLGRKKGPGGQHHGPAVVPRAPHQADAGDGIFPVPQDLGAFPLDKVQPFTPIENAAHIGAIGHPVGLGPGGVDGGALPPVEHPELQAGLVGGAAHLAPQGVDLPDQLALGRPADRGVAGHVAHPVQTGADAQGPGPQAGRGQGGFDARVTGPDDGEIIGPGVKIQHSGHSFS